MRRPILYIFSGLPGTGKSTLAQELAQHIGATYLRIDTIEQGIRDLCKISLVAEGYYLSFRIATDNLSVGNDVIADSCNPCQESRDGWEKAANVVGAEFRNIEIICSNKNEHRQRVETRDVSVPGLVLPSWQDVLDRDYEKWDKDHIVLDTAQTTKESSVNQLLQSLQIEKMPSSRSS